MKKKLLKIVEYPDPVLRRSADSVGTVGEIERSLLDYMYVLMRKSNGLGLAAPQIGVSKRLIVVHVDGIDFKFADPEIIFSLDEETDIEGCLSVPGRNVSVKRAKAITVRAISVTPKHKNGIRVEISCAGLIARVIQHEIDHLNGKLIIDYEAKK